MDFIKEWYNGTQDYSLGVSIYTRLGNDEVLKRLLKKGPTPFLVDRLREELLNLIEGTPGADLAASLHSPTDLLGENADTLSREPPKDETLQKLYERKRILHKEKDLLRHTLEGTLNVADRGRMAFRILEIRDEITAIWNQEDHYRQFARLPEENPGVTDPNALKHRRHIVNSDIRRMRTLLKKDPQNQRVQERMARYEAEYEELKERIKKLL